MTTTHFKFKEVFNITVVVAALGYFVDVYDLVLFLIVGEKSLLDLLPGISKDNLDKNLEYLLNVQMIGMLIGGILWGILGDKKGRLSVLFGSILMYSLANVSNGLITQLNISSENIINVYAILRLLAGIGLAGELGAGITLVSEIMSKEKRGYGTMIVASVGVTGAVVAAIVGKTIGWEVAYYIGGGLGLCLLILRIGVFESGMFSTIRHQEVSKGDISMLFTNKHRAIKYLKCIMIGLPVWYFIGILVGKGPRIAEVLGVNGQIEREFCILFCYSGLVFGDIFSGTLSQFMKSRKKVFYVFYLMGILIVCVYLNLYNVSASLFYAFIFLLGFAVGFWAILVTVGSEQFGTNLRATAATTIPNFIRGSLVPITILFRYIFEMLKPQFGGQSLIYTGFIVTVIVMVISFLALYFLEETFGKDLDYIEG